MGLFDRKKEEKNENVNIPKPPEVKSSAFPEPPKSTNDQGLGDVKKQVETAPTPPPASPPVAPKKIENEEIIEDELEAVNEELVTEPKHRMPEPVKPTTISPTLYLKLTEYKEVVEATNKMRKDVEKAKNIVSELRTIEKDEHSKLEKSEELIKDIDRIIALFEKTMVTPIE